METPQCRIVTGVLEPCVEIEPTDELGTRAV